jgi:hypothetical protein
MRPAASLIVLVCVLALAGCGGSSSGTAGGDKSSTDGAPPAGTLEALWRAPGEDVAVVAGTSDHGPGENRVSFLVVDSRSRVVTTATAKVWVARGLRQTPFLETTATSERIGVPGAAKADAQELYVATVDLPEPGTYWLLAEPVGASSPIQALGNVVVRAKSVAPAVGDRAVASRTPTLRSTGGDLTALSTSSKPDPELYRSSVAEALAAHDPFVVTFATPKYCQSRTCGPVVDVVDAVRKRSAGSGVRFIHVEIYEDNDPARGTNRWVDEWKLPTEPFTFVVDGTGVIRAKLEGAFSADELAAAVDQVR